MQLAIILTSGYLLIQTLFYGAVLGQSTTLNPLQETTNNTHKSWNSTYNEILKRELFINYDKFAKPLTSGKPSNIQIGLTVRHIDIDELKGKITVYGWLKMTWTDDKFNWTPSNYGNVASMHVPADEVWRPDIALFNSATDRDDHLGGSQLIIYSNGLVLWVPPAVFTAFCSLNLQLWPFDTQNCYLKIGSWSTADIIIYNSTNSELSTSVDSMVENNEWNIEKLSMKFDRKDPFYNSVRFDFKLVRRAAMYRALIFTPASCIVLMILSSFWLPPQMGEKLLLNGIVIVVIAAFLMYFAQLLPVLAQNTPLVVLFYSSSLLLVSISTVASVIVLHLCSAKHQRRVPSFLRNLLNGPLCYVLCLSHLSPDVDQQNSVQKELYPEGNSAEPASNFENMQIIIDSTRSIQFDWIVLATAIDRIFFLFYCIIFIVLAVVYSV